ncbi:hypothetical protein I7V30_01620 [Lelliottia amnigena]|uniref:hypothetical protein n=1 Tax=Lelliottia amnigena TaxID=61646 RepID=UPI00192C7DBA|nr:hypothetical protein [Lelliottia amnigena]MBL5963969.1 hypothetical protein [Lelliottia amnigena]
MEISTVNQLIAAGSGLIGAFIGAGISGLINHRISRNNHDIEKLSYAAGFIAEVESLQTVMRERKYLEALQAYGSDPEFIDSGIIHYSLLIPDNFARFYNANLNKVGLLGVEKTKLLVKYHQLLQSVSQDFKEGSFLQINGFNKEAMEETIYFFSKILTLGDLLLNADRGN